MKQPHIIFICADQLRYDVLGKGLPPISTLCPAKASALTMPIAPAPYVYRPAVLCSPECVPTLQAA